MKPKIELRNARLMTSSSGFKYLIGYCDEHPKLGKCFSPVRTSRIISENGNEFETLNSIYEVKAWAVCDKDDT